MCTVNINNLFSLKDRLTIMEKSGIYHVSCGECDSRSIYIEQTGRKLSQRIHEHETKEGSAVYSHCSNTSHNPSKLTIYLLHQCLKRHLMNASEEDETIKAVKTDGPKLLNDFDSISLHKFMRFYNYSADENPSSSHIQLTYYEYSPRVSNQLSARSSFILSRFLLSSLSHLVLLSFSRFAAI